MEAMTTTTTTSTGATGATTTATGMGAVDRFLAAIEAASMDRCTAYADDAVLDATVPGWRFTRRGIAAIRAEYRQWFADPSHLEGLRRLPIEGGEVVDYVACWEEHGVPHAAHHVHVLMVDNDLIVVDTVMCGGRWPASLLAQMAAADA